jgi:hypothetical protein
MGANGNASGRRHFSVTFNNPVHYHSKLEHSLNKAWVEELADDASFNFESYADCFISENLVRRHIKEGKLPISKEAKEVADRC